MPPTGQDFQQGVCKTCRQRRLRRARGRARAGASALVARRCIPLLAQASGAPHAERSRCPGLSTASSHCSRARQAHRKGRRRAKDFRRLRCKEARLCDCNSGRTERRTSRNLGGEVRRLARFGAALPCQSDSKPSRRSRRPGAWLRRPPFCRPVSRPFQERTKSVDSYKTKCRLQPRPTLSVALRRLVFAFFRAVFEVDFECARRDPLRCVAPPLKSEA